jgi:spore coat polysaccharide biosynthesis protein SpsF (cytidylyltransferase family)
MTLYIKEHPPEFAIVTAELPPGLYRPEYRLTVDEPEDVRLMQEIFSRLAASGRRVTTREAIALLDREPALARINAHLRHKTANLRSVALDAGIGKIV